MNTITYQHIAHRKNNRANAEREKQIMDDLANYAAPLFYAVIAAAAVAVIWHITADYRINAAEKQRESEIISSKLAACANGPAVQLGDSWLTCKVKQYKVKK